jgi:preprotein translocase subunit SecD
VIRSIVQQRLEATGVAWVRVGVPGTDRIVVELPSAGGLAELRALAGATGRLDFVGLGSAPMTAGEPIDLEAHPPLFSGDQVERATLGIDQGGARTIDLVLREPGRRLFADYTAAHVGDTFAIVLDGVILAAPVIQEAIPDGRVQVSPGAAGPLAAADAQRFVTIIRLGALPFPLQEVAVTP